MMPAQEIIEPVLQTDDIQGNIIPGFKKDNQHFLFFNITDAVKARAWLQSLHGRITNATEVFQAHALWKEMRDRLGREPDYIQFLFLNVGFTATGLRRIVAPAEVDQFGDNAFKLGMSARSALLGDPSANSGQEGNAGNWLVGGTNHAFDVVFILASDDAPWIAQVDKDLEAEAAGNGLVLVHADHGKVLEEAMAGHEPFGFKDGVSEPAVRGRRSNDPNHFLYSRTIPPDPAFDALRLDFASPGKLLVWPGHFLFGYGRQARDDPRTVDENDKPKGPTWAANGSFMVYRRLQQHVDRFETFLDQTSAYLQQKYPGKDFHRDRLGALLVGRWKSGTPLMRSPDTDLRIEGEAANYFQFYQETEAAIPGDSAPLNAADPDGDTCPFGAHIRKVNPRDDPTDLGPGQRTPPKLILRRGIPYDASTEQQQDKGLLFVAYQSSIEQQFEFLMTDWVNQSERPRSGGGQDPLLHQGPGKSLKLQIDGNPEPISLPGNLVTPTGGEYVFLPPIRFFAERLAQST